MTGEDRGARSAGRRSGSTEARVRRALADADVGADLLSTPLAAAAGVGDVGVDGGVARVELTLPVPPGAVRSALAEEVEAAAARVDGVDAAACEWSPAAADPETRTDFLSEVKNVLAVSSGKGGVGKSTVAVNVAAALAEAGASVGLLDADVYGPNAPAMLGLSDRTPGTTRADQMVPREAHGVKVMSMGFIVGEDDPVIWRGPVVDDFVQQLFGDVEWGALDYLVVDLPPGTGDTQLSLVQHLPVTGAVVVTTPPPVALDDARRGLEQFERYGVPVLGLAENMSGFTCPDCGEAADVFGSEGADELADETEVPVLGRVPLDSAVGALADEPSDPPGVTVPLVGTLRLPRTREEREGQDRLPPIAVREGGGEPRRALRALSARIAARTNAVARETAADRT